MRTFPGFRKALLVAALAALLPPSVAAPASAVGRTAAADPVLVRADWSCAVPYSGERSCTPPLAVPPGGYLWIGDDSGGPTVFQVYLERGPGGRGTRVGWTELRHGAVRAYTNATDAVVRVVVTLHADAPTDRCGSRPEHGFIEVRRDPPAVRRPGTA